jgi:peptidoglycan/xylan/chitin deacetylase (PgdA/CDA1 family)
MQPNTTFLCAICTIILLHACNLRTEPIDGVQELAALEHRQKEVVVFVYHRFGDPRFPSTNINLADFEAHLSYLKSEGFTVMKFGEVVDYISDPSKPYVEKAACLTVDDGYKTFYSNAMPLIEKYGFSASLFINSESVRYGDYMDWEQLKAVHSKGVEIGNHSHSHPYFLNMPPDERISNFEADVKRCQELIKEHLGFYPEVFAYPYGEFDFLMKEALKELGFKAAAAQNSGVLYNHDIYATPRFPMAGPFTSLAAFKEKAHMRALRIISKSPASSLVDDLHNPPAITIQFDSTGADLARYNCFITEECKSSIEGNTLKLQAEKPLNNRRTLYKITAPAKNGAGWYWYSHLWVRPEVSE